MSGGGGGGETRTQSTTVQSLSPEQRELYDLVIPSAKNFIGQQLSFYPESTVAGFTPLQLAGQQMVVDAARDILPGQISQAQDASKFLLGPVLYPESNPALAAATDAAIRPVTENFLNNILPALGRDSISAGQYGGTRQGISEGLAAKETIAQTGDIAANIANEAYGKGLSAMTTGLALQPQLFREALLPGTATEAVGGQERALIQARLSEDVNKYITEQLLPFLKAQAVAGIASGVPGGSVTTTGVGTGPQAQGISPAQGALAGASIGTSISPGYGTAIGAGAGALLSLLG